MKSSRREILGPVAVRLVTYPATIGCSVLTASLLIRGASVDDYAAYTLIASLLPILAFLDLGFGGAATNWATHYSNTPDGESRELLKRRLRTALFTSGWPSLVGVAAALLSVYWSVGTGATWLNIPIAVLSTTLIVYFLTVPLSIISKLLIGIGRSSTWIAIQVLQPVTALAFVAVCVAIGEDVIIPIAPAVSLLIMCLTGSIFALRAVRIDTKSLVSWDRDKPQEPVFSAAWPMMIILIANPLALSSDRLILAWVGDNADVAAYSLGSQLFAPALTLLSTMGLTLWPYYAKRRFQQSETSPWRLMLIFAVVACAGSALLIICSPWLAGLISGGQIALPTVLVLCFSASLIIQSSQLPMGMYMMHGSGPRYQAGLLIVMFAVKFALSLLLIPALGAGGPALATASAILLCQVIPAVFLVKRGTV